jgi:hypothetical protein
MRDWERAFTVGLSNGESGMIGHELERESK